MLSNSVQAPKSLLAECIPPFHSGSCGPYMGGGCQESSRMRCLIQEEKIGETPFLASSLMQMSGESPHPNGNKYTSNSRRSFDVSVFALNLESKTKTILLYVYLYLLYVYLIQIDGAQNASGICMCIEFIIRVFKEKNVHVFFLLAWQRGTSAGNSGKAVNGKPPGTMLHV